MRRLARLRPQAISYAQKAVRLASFTEKRFFSREERLHAKQVAKFQFYWQSGEPVLMREAVIWAAANPGALPEAVD